MFGFDSWWWLNDIVSALKMVYIKKKDPNWTHQGLDTTENPNWHARVKDFIIYEFEYLSKTNGLIISFKLYIYLT